ncbi:MAG: hypothetical protein AB1750_18440 [Chloroflexota bacterium]
MTDRIRAVILCEDRQQEVFARTFLETCGIRPVRVRINPAGRGAGDQFVRVNYPAEARTFRRKFPAQPDTRLVVLMDADNLSIRERFQQLDNALQQNDLPTRQPQERIGIFVPKRNIETWIHYLKGLVVNEDAIYPRLNRESECKTDVEALARNRRAPLPENAPPSMRAACLELPRVLDENA